MKLKIGSSQGETTNIYYNKGTIFCFLDMEKKFLSQLMENLARFLKCHRESRNLNIVRGTQGDMSLAVRDYECVICHIVGVSVWAQCAFTVE